MKKARVYVQNRDAGVLEEIQKGKFYRFRYHEAYEGPPVSLTMPSHNKTYEFQEFPPFFDGLLPEGIQLQGLLKYGKIDADDFFEQLLRVGSDLVGAVTVEAADDE